MKWGFAVVSKDLMEQKTFIKIKKINNTFTLGFKLKVYLCSRKQVKKLVNDKLLIVTETNLNHAHTFFHLYVYTPDLFNTPPGNFATDYQYHK